MIGWKNKNETYQPGASLRVFRVYFMELICKLIVSLLMTYLNMNMRNQINKLIIKKELLKYV